VRKEINQWAHGLDRNGTTAAESLYYRLATIVNVLAIPFWLVTAIAIVLRDAPRLAHTASGAAYCVIAFVLACWFFASAVVGK